MDVLELIFVTFAALAAADGPPPAGADCGEQVCLYASGSDGSSWKPDDRLSAKQRRREAKRNRKRRDIGLSVDLVGGRGSVFIDGRYLATSGSFAERELKPGKHELEVRDGTELVTAGVLVISRKAKGLRVVVHADR